MKGASHNQMDIAVFVSGGGTNLQALIDHERLLGDECPYHICLVVSSTLDAFAITRARDANIPVEITSVASVLGTASSTATRDEKRRAISDAALSVCRRYGAKAIVLAGWLTVLCGNIITQYSGRIVNLHPALLPKFGGVGMWGHHVHEAVLAAGEKESGCTVHLVDSGCDTGRILVQHRVPVMADDTPQTLYERIAPEEHKAIVEGVEMLSRMLESQPPQ